MKANFTRKILLIFLLVSLAGSFILPKTALAETNNLELTKKEKFEILDAIQKQLTEELTNFVQLEPEKQLIISLVRNAIRNKEIIYILDYASGEAMKASIRLAKIFVAEKPIIAFLNELEKMPIEKAKKLLKDWLVVNEIKAGGGTLKRQFLSYKGNIQKISFPYIIEYQTINRNQGKIVVEIYSQKEFEPPQSRGSPFGFSFGNPWDINEWSERGNEKIKPFIIKIEGNLRKKEIGPGTNYIWQKPPKIEINFSENLPEFGPPKDTPAALTELKSSWSILTLAGEKFEILPKGLTNTIEKIKETKETISKVLEKVKSFVLKTEPQKATLVGKKLTEQVVEEKSAERKSKKEIKSYESTQIKTEKKKLTKKEMKESLDDILKKTEIINQKAAKIQKEIKEIEREEQKEIKKLKKTDKEKIKKEIKKEKEEIKREIVEQKIEEQEKKKEEKEEIVFCNRAKAGQAKRDKVIINEVAWMGTKKSPNNEWIELKNISSNKINLSGWQLLDKDKQIKIIFEKEDNIWANGFYLLERTDDNSVPGILADKIYKGNLNNRNEALYLFDKNCNLEDEVLANPDWPAGDNLEKRTMERNDDLNWHTFQGISENEIFGTPKKENSQKKVEEETEQIVHYSGGGTSSPTPIPKIIISEIQISGLTSKGEFIELFNPNNESVNLSNFKLKKKTSSGNESSLVSSSSFSGTISPFGYFLIVPQLNDDGTPNYQGEATPDLYYSGKDYSIAPDNTILLYDRNNNLADKVGFGNASDFETAAFQNPGENQTIGRKLDENENYIDTDDNSNDFEIQIPTPKEKNQTYIEPLILPLEILSPGESTIFNEASDINLELDGIQILIEGTTESLATVSIQETLYQTIADENGNWQIEVTINEGENILNLKAVDDSNNESEIVSLTIYLDTTPSEPETSTYDVVINEIAWMGTRADNNDEWIELFNNTNQDINLSSWQINSLDGSLNIVFENSEDVNLINNIIPAKGFYFLERGDDNTVKDISANLIYGNDDSLWNLNDNGENLELRDQNNNLIDKISCQKDENGNCLMWFFGTAGPSYVSMERFNPENSGEISENWEDNNMMTINGIDFQEYTIYGTPKNYNSIFLVEQGKGKGILPQTFQTSFYQKGDDGYFQKGCSQGYLDNEDGTITDLCTDLIWVKDGIGSGCNNGQSLIWQDAINFSNDLEFAGYSDWRLPNYNELLSIVDYSKSNPAVNSDYFINTFSNKYWTSSGKQEYYEGTGWITSAAYVNFENGFSSGINNGDKASNLYYIRPVRGISLTLPLTGKTSTVLPGDDGNLQMGCNTGIVDNGDGTFTDLCTNLMWKKDDAGHSIWSEAIKEAGSLNFAGYSDWRLPSIRELIVSRRWLSCSDPDFWTSTTYTLDSSKAWGVRLKSQPGMTFGMTKTAVSYNYGYFKVVRDINP